MAKSPRHEIYHLTHFFLPAHFSCVKYFHIVVQPSSRTFSSRETEILDALNNHSPLSVPQSLAAIILLSVFVILTTLDTTRNGIIRYLSSFLCASSVVSHSLRALGL